MITISLAPFLRNSFILVYPVVQILTPASRQVCIQLVSDQLDYLVHAGGGRESVALIYPGFTLHLLWNYGHRLSYIVSL